MPSFIDKLNSQLKTIPQHRLIGAGVIVLGLILLIIGILL